MIRPGGRRRASARAHPQNLAPRRLSECWQSLAGLVSWLADWPAILFRRLSDCRPAIRLTLTRVTTCLQIIMTVAPMKMRRNATSGRVIGSPAGPPNQSRLSKSTAPAIASAEPSSSSACAIRWEMATFHSTQLASATEDGARLLLVNLIHWPARRPRRPVNLAGRTLRHLPGSLHVALRRLLCNKGLG